MIRALSFAAARDKALQEAKLKAATISGLIDGLEEKYNSPDVVVKDLVASFLLPAVEREGLRTKSAYPSHTQIRIESALHQCRLKV